MAVRLVERKAIKGSVEKEILREYKSTGALDCWDMNEDQFFKTFWVWQTRTRFWELIKIDDTFPMSVCLNLRDFCCNIKIPEIDQI